MKSLALYTMIALSGMVFGAEIVASHVTQSLALLISAYHMLYNILSLLLLVVNQRMSKGKTLKNTFGWARVKVLGMLVNMLFLSALCFAACVEAVQTVVHASHEDTEPRHPLLVLCLGIINFILNILCFVLIGGYTHHQGCSMIIQENQVQVNYVLAEPNIGNNAVCTQTPAIKNFKKEEIETTLEDLKVSNDHKILDISRDISSGLAVIACGAIVLLLDGLLLKYVDAVLAVASVVVLLVTTYPFIRETGFILLQSIPNHIDVNGLTERLLKQFPDVQNVHDLHVWRLTASEVIATVHVSLPSSDIYISNVDRLHEFFNKEGINLVTIQPEFSKESSPKGNYGCILQCSNNNNCGALTCCGPLTEHYRENVRLRIVNHGNANDDNSCIDKKKRILEDYNNDVNSQDCDLPLLSQYDFERIRTATETKV